LSHLLSRSRCFYEASAAHVRQVSERMKRLNEAAEGIQVEHKRKAVDQELTAVKRRVLSELKNAKMIVDTKAVAKAVDAAISHEKYTEPADKAMIMIFQDGTVQGGYGFRPVGPRTVTQAEFENMINTFRNRASTDPLNLELAAAEIVRRYFVESYSTDAEK
jgi:hypothetical protein